MDKKNAKILFLILGVLILICGAYDLFKGLILSLKYNIMIDGRNIIRSLILIVVGIFLLFYNKNKNMPTHLLFLKYTSIVSLTASVALVALYITNFSIFLLIGAMLSITIFIISLCYYLRPAIEKMKIEENLYVQENTKKTQTKIASNEADIEYDSIKKKTSALKQGFKGSGKCPKCGDDIQSDEKFCSNCGIKLENICAKCGKQNDAKDKFCKECGNKL